MILGIDASNIRTGGGLVHLRELLAAAEPEQFGFEKVVVWSGRATLAQLPQRSWLKLVWQPECDRNLFVRSMWQARVLPRLAKEAALGLLFTPGGTHVGGFRPYVTMVQNDLPFNRHQISRYGFSKQYFRLHLLRQLQLRTLRNASGVIFLTEHSRRAIQSQIGDETHTSTIPHGVSARFNSAPRPQRPISEYSPAHPFRFLYVSSVEPYKEHLKLVRAFAKLHSEGLPIALDIAGDGEWRTLARLKTEISAIDPDASYIRCLGPMGYPEVADLYRTSDAFVFPSTCETFGMPVLEAMAAGLPIACSNQAVMPEILGKAGAYFVPKVDDIAACLRRFVDDVGARREYADAAARNAASFTWDRTARLTFGFLAETAGRVGAVPVRRSSPRHLQKGERLLTIGIDASNLRAGGGLVHLREILRAAEPENSGIKEVLVWGGRDSLAVLPQRPWLRPIWLPQCDENIISRLAWQTRVLPRLAADSVDLLFVPGGTHVGKFKPFVTMIRNWLLFDRHELMRYGLSRQVIRLEVLRYLQVKTLREAAGVIFLTEYSRDKVRPKMRSGTDSIVIPHGVSDTFRYAPRPQLPITNYSIEHPFQFLYVSWVEPYKEQARLVRAVAKIRSEGCPVALHLAGAGETRSVAELKALISKFDPEGRFLHYHGPVRYPEIADLYHRVDAFAFPSSCETFGMPMLEAMAAGLPVASSNKAVMPEVMGDAGVLFTPEVDEMAACLRRLADDVDMRQKCAMASARRAEMFTWSKTAERTFAYLADTCNRYRKPDPSLERSSLVLQD